MGELKRSPIPQATERQRGRRPSAEVRLAAAANQIGAFFQPRSDSVLVHVASVWNVFDEPSKTFMARRRAQFVGEESPAIAE